MDEGKKGYAPRGDDHMKPAGGAGWFEPPEDTTISSDTPSWFKVDAVQTQKVAQKRGRGSSLSREAASSADQPRRTPQYESEQHSHFGGRPDGVKLAAKHERWAHDRHGSCDPVSTAERYTSINRLCGTSGPTPPYMRSPGQMDERGFREADRPQSSGGGFRRLQVERDEQEAEQRARRIEQWGGVAPADTALARAAKKQPALSVPMQDLTAEVTTTRGRTKYKSSYDRFCCQEEWRAIPKGERRRAPPAAWAHGAASVRGPPQPSD